jgi:DNA-binding IscR family transcriptional regulator
MENLKSMVLGLIPDKRAEAIQSKELQVLTGLPLRKLKEVITELRKEHPICSKETDGGGYWMAENENDIREFIMMIAKRRNGYTQTINRMQRHLDDM